jgi:aspartyl-tRNA(Asn)/glutamyl-tRNA(Gln) amidotransferase subunit A
VVGVRPTYGAVSLTGVLPNCPSLDVVGPLTTSLEDARLVLAELVAHDDADPVSAPTSLLGDLARRLAERPRPSLSGVRLGILDEPLFEVVEERARRVYEEAVELLGEHGAAVITLSLPEARFFQPTWLACALTEGAAIHTHLLRERPSDLGDEVRSVLNVGHALPAVLGARAKQARRQLSRLIADVFRRHQLDVLVAPASTAPPVPRNELDRTYVRASGEVEPVLWWGFPRVFYLAAVTGLPAVAIPMVAEGPPLGIQLTGRPFEDDRLLDVAAAVAELLPVEEPAAENVAARAGSQGESAR